VKTWTDEEKDVFTLLIAMVKISHFSQKVDSCGYDNDQFYLRYVAIFPSH
jgi:hypothetical protein